MIHRVKLSRGGRVVLTALKSLMDDLIEGETQQDEALEIVLEITGDWYGCLAMLSEPGIDVELESSSDSERVFKLTMLAMEDMEGDHNPEQAYAYYKVFSRMLRFVLIEPPDHGDTNVAIAPTGRSGGNV